MDSVYTLSNVQMEAWLAEHSKEYEAVADLRDADRDATARALDLVRDFIAERGLILYGGQAIDFALRLRGSRLYPDHQTPDYDFFSPDNVGDAYDLTDRLKAAGFENVGAITAIHTQTMRVKFDFVFVADISYAPPAVFERLPTLNFRGMRVLHPDYQRTDMHLAFCFPFNSPPLEDVFHRFGKDLRRLRMLEAHFPVTTGARLNAPVVEGGRAPATFSFDPSRSVFHGLAAYALMRRSFARLVELSGAGAEQPEWPAGADIDVRDGKVVWHPPAGDPTLVLASPWAEEVAAAVAGDAPLVRRRPYMDSRPRTVEWGGDAASGGPPAVRVFDTHDRLLAVSPAAGARMVSSQYLLLYFLHEAHVADERRDLFVRHYRAVWDMLAAADRIISAAAGKNCAAAVARFVECSPFGLSVQTLGDRNASHAYLSQLARTAQQSGLKPPGFDVTELPSRSANPPPYYPSQGKPRPPPFDYDRSPPFLRDGSVVQPDSDAEPAGGVSD